MKELSIDSKNSPFIDIFYENYKSLEVVGPECAADCTDWTFVEGIFFNAKKRKILVATEKKAPELLEFFGPSSQEVLLSKNTNCVMLRSRASVLPS